MAQVAVTIADRTYRMACEDGQEGHLVELSEQINGHIAHLRESFGDVGDMRLLVMASLVLADELDEAKRAKLDAQAETQRLNELRLHILKTIEAAQDQTAETLDTVAERIETIAESLSAPMATRS